MKKQYIKLIIFNNAYFVLYTIGLIWESGFEDAKSYGGPFALLFFPVLLAYLVFYGCYSYAKTKHIILPNLLLLFFLNVEFFWMLCYGYFFSNANMIYKIPKIILLSIICTGISVLIGLLTRLIIFLVNIKKFNNPKE